MRQYGALNPTDQIPIVSDTVMTAMISSAGAVVAQDFPAGAGLVYFSGPSEFYVTFGSTGAAIPSASSTGSTGSAPTIRNPGVRQIVPGSTGFSVTAGSSGPITAEFWRK